MFGVCVMVKVKVLQDFEKGKEEEDEIALAGDAWRSGQSEHCLLVQM